MAFGAIVPAALGAITAPSAAVLATPASVGASAFPAWGSIQAIPLPSINAVFLTHGNIAQRYAIEGSTLLLGLLAPTGTMTAADHGSGSLAAGDYQYGVSQFRSLDGALSGTAIQSIDIAHRTLGGSLLSYSNTPAHTVDLAVIPALVSRDATDFKRVMRTLVGADLLYRLTDLTGTTYTDALSDASISGAGAFQYDETKYRPREAGYPVVGRFAVIWRNRLWTAGATKCADYTAGGAVFTNGSATVTFSTEARPKADMIGRFITRTADTIDEYQIVAVDEATPGVTLSRVWTGTTNALAANFRIRDSRDPCELFYTEPALFNNSPPTNSIRVVQSRDPRGVTGLAVLNDRLVVFTPTGLWTVSGDVGSWEVHHVGEGFGCFCGNAVQSTPTGLYWLGPEGVFEWRDSVGTPTLLSKPQDDPRGGIQGTIDSINAEEAVGIVSNYNPSSHRIRWWLPLDTDVTNRHCLRLDLQTRTFATHTASDVTAAATVPGPNGRAVTLTGDQFGCWWQIDAGYVDGAFGFEPVQTVASWTAATRTLAVSGTPLPTSGNGLAGVTVLILPAAGPPYQMATVASNTSSAAVLTAPLSTAPAANDIVVFGGIPFDADATFDNEQPEILKWVEGLVLSHEIETSGATEVWCGACADNDVPAAFTVSGAADSALVTATDGEKHFWLYTARGRILSIRFLAIGRGYRVRLRGFVLSVRAPLLEEVVE